MSHFKYDDFIRVLGIVKRSVCKQLCGENVGSLYCLFWLKECGSCREQLVLPWQLLTQVGARGQFVVSVVVNSQEQLVLSWQLR